MRIRLRVAIILAGAAWCVACSSGEQTSPVSDDLAVRVETALVEHRMVDDVREIPGTVRAVATTVVSSETRGVIEVVSVGEGDRVARGQVVVEIADERASVQFRRATAAEAEARQALVESERMAAAAESSLDAAAAQRDLAAATHDRFAVLRDRGSVSPQEYEEVETRLVVASAEVRRAADALEAARSRRMQVLASIERTEAEVDGARIAVTDTRIAAPIDGVVTSRHAEEGMLASPGMPLLTIEDDSGWEIEAAVPESQMGAIRVGQELPVRIDLVGRVVEGTVTEIVPAADPLTRTFTVRLALRIPAELDTPLRSGSFGRVAISEGEREAIVIPSEAIVRRGQLDGVYMVGDDDRAFFRLVETRRRADDSDTEILAGLRDGDRIVTQTAPSLTDGVRIDILGGSDTP